MPVVTVRPNRSLSSPVQPTFHLDVGTRGDGSYRGDQTTVATVLACHRSLKRQLIRCGPLYLVKTVDVFTRAQRDSRLGKRA